MKKLMRKLKCDNYGRSCEQNYEIITENSKKLSKIFDKVNDEICGNCSRDKHREGNIKLPTGCCTPCFKENGFFRIPLFLATYQNLEKIKKEFNFDKDHYGFFNNDTKRCNLPRELRSGTCLRYVCSEMKITESKRKEIDKMVHLIGLCKEDARLPY